MLPGEKILFLVGFGSGIVLGSPSNFEVLSPPRLTNKEIAKEIDQFYTAPENITVPICIAIPILAKKVSGAEKSSIDTMVGWARGLR